MNKKVSLVLRIVAVLAAAGAIALFFMIRGEMENAFVKTKPLDQVRNVNTTTLRDRVERTNAVAEEVFDLRDTKERNEKTIASQKNTIAQKNDEIDGLKADLDTKTEEANQLTRDKEALSAEVSDLNGKVSDLESQLRSEKERVAQLTEEKSNMYSKEEYDQKLAEIEELQKTKVSAGQRYARFRNWVIQRGEAVPSEFPVDLYAKAEGGVVVEFEPEYVLSRVVLLDHARGQLVVGVGSENPLIVPGSQVVLEVDGERVAEARITESRTSKSTLALVPGAQIGKLADGTYVKVIPALIKKAK
ncbi:MAG TPA: hypothetical protein IAC75_05510 [Candidatus Spyradosoma merdigallinarum]|uniref:Uncharacterized protein n=1 Tax=Candidatus Spyradosoma merdigallinarum TaxID=2840950 RepID=A0A9D1T2C0_9BACT|nr:hypothetical protein [Candidatus Spyradosoma merdigallinarum]